MQLTLFLRTNERPHAYNVSDIVGDRTQSIVCTSRDSTVNIRFFCFPAPPRLDEGPKEFITVFPAWFGYCLSAFQEVVGMTNHRQILQAVPTRDGFFDTYNILSYDYTYEKFWRKSQSKSVKITCL